MKKIIQVCLCILLCLCLTACDEEKNVETDLTGTLDALIAGTTENAYLYHIGTLLTGYNLTGEAEENNVNRQIRNQVTYEVKQVTVDGDTAQADLVVCAPDVLQIMEEQASWVDGQDVEALLALVGDQLAGENCPEKSFEVTVSLKHVDDHWYLVPDSRLYNAFSGGLLERYTQIIQKKMENWGSEHG